VLTSPATALPCISTVTTHTRSGCNGPRTTFDKIIQSLNDYRIPIHQLFNPLACNTFSSCPFVDLSGVTPRYMPRIPSRVAPFRALFLSSPPTIAAITRILRRQLSHRRTSPSNLSISVARATETLPRTPLFSFPLTTEEFRLNADRKDRPVVFEKQPGEPPADNCIPGTATMRK